MMEDPVLGDNNLDEDTLKQAAEESSPGMPCNEPLLMHDDGINNIVNGAEDSENVPETDHELVSDSEQEQDQEQEQEQEQTSVNDDTSEEHIQPSDEVVDVSNVDIAIADTVQTDEILKLEQEESTKAEIDTSSEATEKPEEPVPEVAEQPMEADDEMATEPEADEPAVGSELETANPVVETEHEATEAAVKTEHEETAAIDVPEEKQEESAEVSIKDEPEVTQEEALSAQEPEVAQEEPHSTEETKSVEPEESPAQIVKVDEPAPDSSKSLKIKELEDRVSELELSLQTKDSTITDLQTEVQRLNTEIKSQSVPSPKKPGSAGDPKSKSAGAKRAQATRPASGVAKATSKPLVNGGPGKKTGTTPTKKAAPAARPKAAPAKTGPKAGAGKKSGKGSRIESSKGVDGEEHAVKLMLRGRGVVCYPPTDFTLEDVKSEKPEEKLNINWVYGYRGRDSQDNIFCLPSNEILYYQAAVGVIYNPATKTQRFYQGHNDDIKCIALNPTNQNIVATGQTAGHDEKEGDPHVRVWNSETFETIAVLGLGHLQRGVGSVSFSPDGKKLLAVDEGNDHTIYVFDWNKKSTIACQKGHQDPVLGAEFLNDNRFVTYGKGHIIFWDIDGNKLQKKSGLFEKHAKPRYITALVFTANGDPITGDSNGNVFLWSAENRKIVKEKIGAHVGTVYSIVMQGEELYTGGQDCKVKKFSSSDLSELDSWQLDTTLHNKVKALQFVGEDLVVGTHNNGMLFGKFGEEPEQIIFGHGAGDLWGGAPHPTENLFVTAGQDKVIYVWDAAIHVPKQRFIVDKPVQSCAFSPCGSVLAVASTTGEWWVMDSVSGQKLSSYKAGPEQIDAISYSPDGGVLAVGSHDNLVYLYECPDVRGDYKLIGKCSGHSSFITHLDFSQDGKVLQTTSGDYEHLFWDAATGDQNTQTKDLRDITMATYTCILGFPVCGIWPVGYDGTDINALCRSNDSSLVATCDDFGLVNLFRYPCCNPNAEWSSFRGHSAHVTKVRFLTGDKEIFSLGGRDQSIIQWGVC